MLDCCDVLRCSWFLVGVLQDSASYYGAARRALPKGMLNSSIRKVFLMTRMTYVVTETCIKCKYTDCVDVCPVDCFREGPNMLVIDPDECIDCTLCVPECPVEAIFAEDDVPDAQQEFIALNARAREAWKPIIESKPAPPDADEWAKVKDKKTSAGKIV